MFFRYAMMDVEIHNDGSVTFILGSKELQLLLLQWIEVEYLLDQAKRFDILDEVQEAFFQFSPDLVEEKIEGFFPHSHE